MTLGSRLKTLAAPVLATFVSIPLFAAISPQPGVINYVEGQVSIGNQELDSQSVGSAIVRPGETLSTAAGKAEILLTPGVLLRVADRSSVTMVSPDLLNTEVRVVNGRAMMEVAEIHRENNLLVDEQGMRTRLEKKGLYDFDADRGQVRVLDGEAVVGLNDREIKVKGGHEFSMNGPEKAIKFDKDNYKDSFYQWASLRSKYLAQANTQMADSYAGGGWWAGPGWYWDPWFSAYTWLPGSGLLYSPFGWGFYSPTWIVGVPYGYHGRGFYHGGQEHFSGRAGGGLQHRGNVSGGLGMRGFPSSRGFAGGGFHGGGFHGGRR